METTIQGKVFKGLGGLYAVRANAPDGTPLQFSCRARGVFRHESEKVLIGDNVLIRYEDSDPDNTAIIHEILPRKNSLIRPPMANLDYLFCVIAAAKPAPVLDTLDKLLAIATHNNITPVVIITKADFSESESARYASIYETAGFPTFVLSAVDGKGVEALSAYIKENVKDGASAAFAGSSGVGKSTLVNAVLGEETMRTSAIRETDGRGRHTTTHRELLFTPWGGAVIDTPGMRAFALDDADVDSLFVDLAELAAQCRFSDCSHQCEPGCAIRRALEDGLVTKRQVDSYIRLAREAERRKSFVKRRNRR